MSAFCAVCTSERGPFVRRPLGRDNALVSVCAKCDDEAPRAYSSVRGYESPYSDVRAEQAISRIASSVGGGITTRGRRIHRGNKTPGFILERVRVTTSDGRRRDAQEAAAEAFAGCSWASEVRYLGIAKSKPSDFHLFERPDPDFVKQLRTESIGEVVADLDKWRAR